MTVLSTDGNAGSAAINSDDEYGVPKLTNQGRFQFTGKVWLSSLGTYYYKARVYSPTLRRFLQTDPIGYEGNNNLYAYVANDPVNGTDPTGTSCQQTGSSATRLPSVTSCPQN